MHRPYRVRLLPLCTLSVLLLEGCWVGSLHPYYTRYSDLKLASDLIGVWEVRSVYDGRRGVCGGSGNENQRSCTITVTREDDSLALVADVQDEDGLHTRLQIQEFDVNGVRFLDGSLLNPGEGMALVHWQHLIDTHSLWKMSVGSDNLTLSKMDDDYLRDLLESQGNSPEVSFVPLEGGLFWPDVVILTASSAALRGFVARHADDARLFPPSGRANHFVFLRK
jgi:hypothetical protein